MDQRKYGASRENLMIPYGRQDISSEDIDSVIEVLKSDFLTQGPVVPKFENALRERFSSKYALAVNSATSALHLACLALGVKRGDAVWTSPISFVASSNCALYCDANIDFVDIDNETFNICIEKLKSKLIKAKKDNKLPKVIIPVHLGGEPCDMEAIKKLSLEYNFYVIEDASHAVGSLYKDSKIGSCLFSDITVFSFHPVKIITTGEGGALFTNNKDIFNKLNILRSHGITRNEHFYTKESDGPWYYQQLELGYNFRITDIQAALGLSQLSRLDEFLSRRHKIASIYDNELKELPLKSQKRSLDNFSSLHLYIIKLETSKLRLSHKQIFEFLRSNKILVNLHYIPIHLQPFYSNLGFKHGDFPMAEDYYNAAISIPIFPTLQLSEQERVISLIKEATNI